MTAAAAARHPKRIRRPANPTIAPDTLANTRSPLAAERPGPEDARGPGPQVNTAPLSRRAAGIYHRRPRNRGMLPNVVIAGAPKCGTTSLFAWLADHPDVCGSIVKEARYFLDPDDPLFKKSSNYRDHGFAGYETYFTHCEAAEAALVVEATPVYLYQRSAPAALAQIEPLPHVVLVFRKPSERVYSHFHFLHDSHARIDSRLPFEEFVRLVRAGDPGIPHYGHAKSVIAHSEYVEYLPAWFERIPRAHIHLFLFEDLRRDPAAFMKAVARQFDIDPSFYDSYSFSRKNTT